MTEPTITARDAGQLQRDTGDALVAALKAHAIGSVDIPVAARLAAKINTGQGFTTEDARSAHRLLIRYAPKIRAVGITIPGVPNAPAAPLPPLVEQRYRPEVAIRNNASPVKKYRYNQHITVSGAPMAANDLLKSTAHAEWDVTRRCWHVPATPAHAAAIMSALADFQPLASERVQRLSEEFASLVARRAILHPDTPEPEFSTTHLVNGTLWGHQRRAVAFGEGSSASMWAIRMGGGKTAGAIALANQVNARRVIIVCPNKVRGVWPREVSKWTARSWHIVDGTREGMRKGSRRQNLLLPERLAQAEANLFDCACGAAVHAAVMNYEMLVHEPVASWHASQPIDLAVYDEVHRAKSPTGTMSRNLAKWVSFTHRRVGLSGTPMPQYPWDIFGVYRALDSGIFGPLWTPFKANYVQMKTRQEGGKPYPAAILKDKRAEFAEKVHSIMYRPTIDLRLPTATHFVRQVEFEPDARAEYDRLQKDLWADLSSFTDVPLSMSATQAEEFLDSIDLDSSALNRIDADLDTLTPRNVLARMMRLMQFTGGTVPNDEGEKRRVSTAKADALMEFEKDTPTGGILFEAGCYPNHPGGPEPVCVYAHFRDDLDVIKGVAQRAGLRYREISGRRGDGLTDTSEMAPDADVVGVQIQSGGTGVDLTRSCFGVWYSKGHSLGDYDQALARQHRPGQTRPVTFVHLEVEDTIDHDVYRSLMSRRAVVSGVLAIHGVNNTDVGGDGDPEVPAQWDTVTSQELFDAGDSGVRLPIDDYDKDVMGDPRPKPADFLTSEQIEMFDLDDVL